MTDGKNGPGRQQRTKEVTMEQPKGRVNLTMFFFPFIFVAIGVLLLYFWYTELLLYNGGQNIQAIIVNCKYDLNGSPNEIREYDIYVDYELNDVFYRNIYWKSFKNKQPLGQIVTVRVNPAQPDRTITYPAPLGTIGVIMGMIGVGLTFKVIPMAFDPKNRHPRPSEGEAQSGKIRNRLPFIIGFGIGALASILIGVLISPIAHIGSILFSYIFISLIDY